MFARTMSMDRAWGNPTEVSSAVLGILCIHLRQAARGLFLGLIGAAVILSVATVLICVSELGLVTDGPAAAPHLILHR